MALRMGKHADARMGPAAVARAYRGLPAEHRETLAETVFAKRSVNEAAAALGVPVDVVKLRVYEALHALRNALGAPGGRSR